MCRSRLMSAGTFIIIHYQNRNEEIKEQTQQYLHGRFKKGSQFKNLKISIKLSKVSF